MTPSPPPTLIRAHILQQLPTLTTFETGRVPAFVHGADDAADDRAVTAFAGEGGGTFGGGGGGGCG